MTKADLVKQVSEALKEDSSVAQQYVEAVIQIMSRRMTEGETLYIRGFGTMGPKLRAAKIARNIKGNTPLSLPPRYKIIFKAAKSLNEAANKNIKEGASHG